MSLWDEVASASAARLRERVEQGDVASSWIFSGPPGSGKRQAAIALAAALNCDIRPGAGCGECRSCERIRRGVHPDVYHLVPEGPLIPVDLIRDVVVPAASLSPFEGRTKVFVIEEAERMNEAAQNALLKTLEEPQEDVVFLLLTEKEQDLLETVKSRCRLIRLEPATEESLIRRLEKEGATTQAAVVAARAGRGDLERARALAFDDEAKSHRRLWLSLPNRLRSPQDAISEASQVLQEARAVVHMREQEQRREERELREALGEGRATGSLRQSLGRRHRRELRLLEQSLLQDALITVASFYRDVLAVRAGADEAVINLDYLDQVEAWGRGNSDADLLSAAERLSQAAASLVYNANPQLALEAALLAVERLLPDTSE